MPIWTRRRRRKLLYACVIFMLTVLSIHRFDSDAQVESQFLEHLVSNNTQRYFIAANLYNNAAIMENFNAQLVRLCRYLGAHRVAVSIYENGALETLKVKANVIGSHDGTDEYLHQLQMDLSAIGVRNRIETEDAYSDWEQGRIGLLASLRNRVLKPLDDSYDRVIFLNDVLWTMEDVVRLIETNDGEWDAVCGLDYYWDFYDLFATRERPAVISNHAISWKPDSRYPYFLDAQNQQRVYRNEPVPVYSCWNGLVVMNAAPFTRDGVEFRSLAVSAIMDGRLYDASECCLVFADFHRLGYTRVFVRPDVRFVYSSFYRLWAYVISPLLEEYLFKPFHLPMVPARDSQEYANAMIGWQAAVDDNISNYDRICIQ